MGRRTLLNFVGVIVLCLAAAGVASAQDFQRSYNLEAGATVSIFNVSGNIELKGYDGSGARLLKLSSAPGNVTLKSI
ncbi:MAG: hypothetical protein QOC99_567 [Acidobacteriota bacterium]|jgi:hypothetical protein|nr:hypothetical protein [Acidobacteriota bacterium]